MFVLIAPLFLILSSAEAILNIDTLTDLSTEQSLSSCAAELCRFYFRDQFNESVIVIFENSTNFSPLRSFLVNELANKNKPCYIIFLNKSILRSKSTRVFKHLLIEISSVDKFKETIEMIKVLPSWNPKANFLIISFTAFEDSKVTSNIIFTILWKEAIVPMAVILIDQKNLTNFNIFTRSSMYDLNIDISELNICRRFRGENITYDKIVTKKMDTFKKVRVKFFPWPPFSMYDGQPGIEIRLIETLAKTCKLTVEYYEIDPRYPSGEVFANGTLTKEFKELSDNKFDIIFGGYKLTYGRILYLSPSISYYYDELLWCVPSKKYYQVNIYIQKMVILLSLLILLVLIVLIWYTNRSEEPKLRFDASIDGIVVKAFAICLHIAITRLPRTGRLRYFVGLLVIFAFFCNIMFTTKITSFFIKREPCQMYDSMSKIYQHNLKTYFVTNSLRYFSNDFIEGISRDEIVKRKIDCHDSLECLKFIQEGLSAFLTTKSNTEYFLNTKQVDKESIYCFHYSYGSSISLIMRKGFLYINEFNTIIHQLLSAGVVQKWKQEIFSVNNKDQKELEVEKLKLQDIVVIFYILIFGCICSCLVFLCEIYKI
ncbi:Ionotropic receptor 119 [Diabrotica virgifera virgifera]|nr:Ionotropic receptor 119 [Diabrotica virgifera virgifera]